METKIFKIARYKDFSKEKNTPDLSKTIDFLQNGDFKSADSKKLVGISYFRAKIDDTNRLIFTFLKEKEKTYIALLEVILNHDYNKSKFLRDKTVELEDFNFEEEKITEILLNPKKELRYLDKFISFSDEQENILTLRPPLLIIGSAGSGKTSVAIEKLKELEGKVLYISLSQHLVDNSKSICGEKSNIDFYSFDSFLNNIEKQDKKEIDFNSFKIWALKNKIRESEKYFEEFKGVLTANYSSKYLLEDEYVSMGIKQSLFKKEERIKVYKSFINYLKYLEESHFYDANIVIFDLLEKIQKVYDFIIIDEVQDFTNKEIYFISQALKNKNNIIFSGDSNQIIYSNFFSWSNLKTMLFDEQKEIATKILTQNYRNSKEITNLSNKLLKIKQLRFGSIDKESNYLIDSTSVSDGNVHFYKATQKNIEETNQETKNSGDVAVIVLDENAKIEAKKVFNTGLTFTVREAKGLEYKNVILFNFITNNSKNFFDIVKDISKEDLDSELKYNRQKDKENRDLETYKIYINSLYVALTRSIENLYILESKNHKLLELLDIQEENKKKIEVRDYTKEEWLEEAKRLKELGKVEQAKEIETKFDEKPIQEKKEYIHQLKDEALNPKRFNKKAKDKFFKLVKEENKMYFIERLAELKYVPAKKYLQSLKNITKKLSDEESKNIFSYINKNDFIKVKKIILRGANLNVTDSNGFTPIMSSIWENNIKILKILIEHEADLNIADIHGVTPLIRASCNGLVEIVAYLLSISINIDVNVKDNKGTTALMDASQVGEKEIVKLLIKNGADVNIKNHDGFTALSLATQNSQEEIVNLLSENNEFKITKEIKDNNSKSERTFFNFGNQEIQKRDLMLASDNGDLKLVNSLIQQGENVNFQNDNGSTPLIYACLNGYTEIVKSLISNGADVNFQNDNGETALIKASVSLEDVDIVEILINAGADINLTTINLATDGKQTALGMAYMCNNIDAMKILMRNGGIDYEKPSVVIASEIKDKEVLISLINDGVDVNSQSDSGETALMQVFFYPYSHEGIIEYLINLTKSFSLSFEDRLKLDENTPSFDSCADIEMQEIIKLLIENGADINMQDDDGNTTLINSCYYEEYIESIKLLIKSGANVNLRNNYGQTPLIISSARGYIQIVKLLIENGAKINLKNNERETALSVAYGNDNQEIIKLLKENGAK